MTTAEKQLPARATQADISIENCGSVFLFAANTDLGREWIHGHVPSDATFWCGRLAVEHRFAYDLAQGMAADGLVLE
jgi:hypothetical protein